MNLRFMLPLFLLLQASVPALAQGQARASVPASEPVAAPTDAGKTRPSKGERQALEWFHMLDTDGDGRISREEARVGFLIRPSLRQLFQDADTNGDGYLTQDEIRAAADRRRAERQRRRAAEEARAAARADADTASRP